MTCHFNRTLIVFERHFDTRRFNKFRNIRPKGSIFQNVTVHDPGLYAITTGNVNAVFKDGNTPPTVYR